MQKLLFQLLRETDFSPHALQPLFYFCSQVTWNQRELLFFPPSLSTIYDFLFDLSEVCGGFLSPLPPVSHWMVWAFLKTMSNYQTQVIQKIVVLVEGG